MKKKRRSTLFQLIVLALLAAALAVCLLIPQFTRPRTSTAGSEIAVILRESDSTPWTNLRLGMEQAAAEFGAELRILTPAEDNDVQMQQTLLHRELEGGCDVLILMPADCSEHALLPQTLGAKQHVVSLESPLSGSTLTIAPDNPALGQALAQAVLEDAPQQPVLLLNTAPHAAGVSARLEAAEQVLQEAGIATQRFSVSAQAIPALLPEYLQTASARCILAFEPSATAFAAKAVSSEVRVYGVGASAELAACLENGSLAALVGWSDYAVGYLAVRAATDPAAYRADTPQNLAFQVLRKEALYETDTQHLLFPITP